MKASTNKYGELKAKPLTASPSIVVNFDNQTYCVRIHIETSSGAWYQIWFDQYDWKTSSVFQKIHKLQSSVSTQSKTNPQLVYAVNILRAMIIQEDKFRDNEMLMRNNLFSPMYAGKQKKVLWEASALLPVATGVKANKPKIKSYSGGEHPAVATLPALDQKVKNPITGNMNVLRYVIIELNDMHKWTREQIADWLETLDVDIRFKPKEVTHE